VTLSTRTKAILDTNVLISAYVFPGGKPEAVYRLALEGHLEIGTSLTLLAEFGRVLGQRFGWIRESRHRRRLAGRPIRRGP
jgi:hypothetical protein